MAPLSDYLSDVRGDSDAGVPSGMLVLPSFQSGDEQVPALVQQVTADRAVAILAENADQELDLQAEQFLLRGDVSGFNRLRDTHNGWDPGLSNLHFDGINLAGANFHGADFKKSIFRSAVLFGADFSFANLHHAVFDLASFDHAVDLYQADLTGASLWNVRGLTSEQLAKVKSLQSVAVTEEFYRQVLAPAFVEYTERLRSSFRVGSGL